MSGSQARQDIMSVLTKLGLLDGLDAGSDVTFSELQMDSLTVIDFCMSLEDATGQTVEPADLVSHPSVDALSAFLDGRSTGNSA